MANPTVVASACQNLESRELSIIVPALRVVGNYLTANDPGIVDVCMWEGCMDKLYQHLLMTNSTIIKETLWAFSNITAGIQQHVKLFVEHPAFDRILVLTKNPNIDVRQEALWVICNAITGVDYELRKKIMMKGGDELISTLI